MRIEQLTFTRFIAAFAVLIFHFGLVVPPFNHQAVKDIFLHSNLGVSYFFILSGYVMIIAYGEKETVNTKSYLVNRVARIYPVYLMAIISLIVVKTIASEGINVKGVFLNSLTIQSWIPGQSSSFNYPGWSITVEFFFYLLFPFLYNKWYSKQPLNKVILPVLFVWVISQVVTQLVDKMDWTADAFIKYEVTHFFPPMHLNEFLVGNLFGLLYLKKFRHKTGNYDWAILGLLALTILLFYYHADLNLHNGFMALTFAPLILVISMNNGYITKFFRLRFLVLLGEISYSMYILQIPVKELMMYVYKEIGYYHESLGFYYIVIVLIIVAYLSYRFVETPLRKKIRALAK